MSGGHWQFIRDSGWISGAVYAAKKPSQQKWWAHFVWLDAVAAGGQLLLAHQLHRRLQIQTCPDAP